MKFGMSAPNRGALATAENLKIIAAKAEALGYDCITISDHIDMNPRPLQNPHPPIWIGGESMPAIRRTAAIGDAWYPFGSNPKFRMDKIETFKARLAKLHREAEKVGRDPAAIELAYNCAFHDSKQAQHVDGGRQSFTGNAQQRADDIGQFADAGVTNLVVNVGADDLNAMLERMEEFASNVMPLVDRSTPGAP